MPRTTDDRVRLLRYLEGDLPPDTRADVESRLESDPEFRRTHDRLVATQRFVQANAEATFAPGFTGRVMDRVRMTRASEASLFDALYPQFLRVALACVLLIAAVGSYNAARYNEASNSLSIVEAAFGLPDVTVQDALNSEGLLNEET
jgi:anti-sigma factor RsiW